MKFLRVTKLLSPENDCISTCSLNQLNWQFVIARLRMALLDLRMLIQVFIFVLLSTRILGQISNSSMVVEKQETIVARQFDSCVQNCSWLEQANETCLASDETCRCLFYNAAGSQVLNCANCLRSVNSSVAELVISSAGICSSRYPVTQLPTLPTRTTRIPSSTNPDILACFDQCALFSEAIATCTDFPTIAPLCACPTVIQGQPCISCLQGIDSNLVTNYLSVMVS